jgi:hypothetical protein
VPGGNVRLVLCVLQAVSVAAALWSGAAAAADYDPRREPEPYRLPDAYVDERPYWMPSGQAMVATPGGFVGFSTWEVEVGGRYFLATGKTQYDLYRAPAGFQSDRISRLTYDSLTSHSGEFFGRVDHATGFFAKGFIGGGVISGGTLKDEDFPPFFTPGLIDAYSSTDSEQRDGRLAYGAIDLGWAWRSGDFSLGFFAGYFHYFERVNAFGCTQTAGHPQICSPSIPSSVQVLSEETNWDAARLGINTVWKAGRWSVTAEAAWLPYVVLNASDTHNERLVSAGCTASCFSGPTPQTASDAMSSVQLEAVLSYAVTPAFSIGVGGRYWNIHTQKGGDAHFEVSGVNPTGFPQAIDFKTESWGVFFQASYKFGQPNSFPGAWY